MKKFGGPGPGPYEKNTGIGEIPAAGPCDVKGLKVEIGVLVMSWKRKYRTMINQEQQTPEIVTKTA